VEDALVEYDLIVDVNRLREFQNFDLFGMLDVDAVMVKSLVLATISSVSHSSFFASSAMSPSGSVSAFSFAHSMHTWARVSSV